MKIALVTTLPSVRSGIGDYVRHLLPYLREHCDVRLFVHDEDPVWEGEDVRSVRDLAPRDFDQIVYQLGNEVRHGFMARMVRAIGGTVVQHDWVLFDMAMAAYPGLVRGGAKGHALALREGGPAQARTYLANWLERRRQKRQPERFDDPESIPGTILYGWHDPEESGRWTADHAAFRLPAEGVEEVELDVHCDPGRTLRVLQGERVLFEGGGGVHSVRPVDDERPVLSLETRGIRVTEEQRRHGDPRRLGCCVRRIAWTADGGRGELDLSVPCTRDFGAVTLSRDRFLLPLNRSVVRFGDAFIVHSRYVRDRILAERNATTPIGIVHHGSEMRWGGGADDRRSLRERLGLGADWVDAFLITSFGGVQPHKRIDKALEALARVRRERDDVRLVLAGARSGEAFDPEAHAKQLGIADAVHFTGFVDESVGWEWLRAGDVALNLRGPSSGGTSGGIFQAFSLGRGVIASDAAEQRELPDSCVVKIPLGEGEVQALARAILALRDDPRRRDELEAGARRFVEEECTWAKVAERYAELLRAFPRPMASRRRIVAMRLAVARP